MLVSATRLIRYVSEFTHCATLVLSLLVASVAAHEVQGDDYEAFGSSLVGQTDAEVRTLVEQKYPRYFIRSSGFMSPWTQRENVGLERYQLIAILSPAVLREHQRQAREHT